MKIPTHVIAAIMASEWAIEQTFLDTIISVANRGEPILGPITSTKLENPSEVLVIDENIAIINLVGPIIRYGSFFEEVCTGAISLDRLTKVFNEALSNPDVKGILLNIDSPGGQANGISEFSDMVRASHKPVHAYAAGSMASGAYWIGCAASHVTAVDTAFIGSIGVVVSVNKSDDDSITITNSKSPQKRVDPSTTEGRAYITRNIDALAEVFYNKVSLFRNTPVEKVISDFGKGGMVIATEAVAVGMIDAVGSFDSALKQLKEQVMNKFETVEELQAASPELVSQIVAQAEAKVREEMKQQLEASAAQANEAKLNAEGLRKQVLSNKLCAIVGVEVSAKLMDYDGALAEGQLIELANLIGAKDAAIAKLTDDLGGPKGTPASIETVIDSEAATVAAVKKVMAEEGLSEIDALTAVEERKLKGKV